MKVAFDESLSWDKDSVNPDVMKVLPVNFSTEHKQMLAHLHMLINKEYLAIPKEYDKLIISLRTSYANEYSLIRNKLRTRFLRCVKTKLQDVSYKR